MFWRIDEIENFGPYAPVFHEKLEEESKFNNKRHRLKQMSNIMH